MTESSGGQLLYEVPHPRRGYAEWMLQSGESAQNILEFASLLAIPVQGPPFCCFAGALYDYPQTDPALTAGMLLYGDFGPLSVSQVIFSKNGPFPMVGSLLVRDAPPPPITVTWILSRRP